MTTPYEQARVIAQTLLKPETPPFTVEMIRHHVMKAATVVQLGEGEDEKLVKELEANFNVWIGVGSALDYNADHVPWLPRRRSEITWRYWNRFQRFLEEELAWPPKTLDRFAELTDSVLERLEDPGRGGVWDRRGLVVGHVQSGKTANYTGLICKAADAGYRLIIVLAGIHSSLRSQTQLRLDEGFLGYDSRQAQSGGSRRIIGVGRLDPSVPPPNTVTTSLETGDFNRNVAKQFNINPGDRPLLFVVKKNASVLRNLLAWVQWAAPHKDEQGKPVVTDLPLLVIDDEADFASVDTKAIPLDENGELDREHDPTAINGLIRSLLNTFRQSAYVGYTATPFANIFIHQNAATNDHGPDLFPQSFVINLPAPSNYVSPARVFGLDADTEAGLEETSGLPIIREVEDQENWMPDKHKTGHFPGPLPASLKEAIRAFVLVCTTRLARGQTDVHNSMLIHVTRFTAVQEKVADQVREELKNIQQRLHRGDGNASQKLVSELEALWAQDFQPTTRQINDPDLPVMEWSELEPHLHSAASRIEIRTVNGTAKDVLDYVDNQTHGLSIIAIGGDKLSRGLTLEGLSVSYYLRASRMYDTLMQMGRWFGYRPGYLDLCRLYTTGDLIEWYEHITAANEELRNLFDYMALVGGTPADFGLRVKSHPDGLLITGAVKMRNSVPMELSFAGDISETVVFHREAEVVQRNFEVTEGFVSRLNQDFCCSTDATTGTRKWGHVSGQAIIDGFLSRITVHQDARKVKTELLQEYIRQRVDGGELTDWTVALISSSNGTLQEIAGLNVGMIHRGHHPKVKETQDRFVIRRLLSPQDEAVDLDDKQREEALAKTQQAWTEDPGRSKRKTPPSQPSGIMIRNGRLPQNGLLLIYLLDPEEIHTAHPLVGFALSFPGSNQARKVVYRVNNVYWQQEYGEP